MKVDIDTHLHTPLSKCCHDPASTIENIAAVLAGRGYRLIAVTDHVWGHPTVEPNSWYRAHPESGTLEQADYIHAHAAEFPLAVLAGCEADMKAPGIFGITQAMREKLDLVMLSSDHFQLRDFVEQPSEVTPENLAKLMMKFFRSAVRESGADILTHPLYTNSYDEFYDRALDCIGDAELLDALGEAAERKIALELNAGLFVAAVKGRYRWDSQVRVFTLAKQAGCKFTMGTDAHKMADFDLAPLCGKMADEAGITEADLMDFSRWTKR